MKRSVSALGQTDLKAGSLSVASEFDTIFSKIEEKPLGSTTHFPRGESTTKAISKQSETKKSHLSDVHQTLHNVYSPNETPLCFSKPIIQSGIAGLTDKNSKVVSNFWTNVSLRISKPLKETPPRISTPVLAKRLGYPLCQIFELIEAGSIICRNGLIPDEEAERLLHPKIEIKE